MTFALLLQALVSLMLTGIIWCIQLCHYPMFERLDRARFCQSLEWHGRAITPLVAPLMLLELVVASWLWVEHPGPASQLGLVLVAGLWLSTGLIQVPLHSRLVREPDPQSLRRLVTSNWLRTVLWTLRGLLALAMLPLQ